MNGSPCECHVAKREVLVAKTELSGTCMCPQPAGGVCRGTFVAPQRSAQQVCLRAQHEILAKFKHKSPSVLGMNISPAAVAMASHDLS